MMKINFVRAAVAVLTILTNASSHAQVACETDNASLRAMPLIEVTLTRADDSTYTMPAKLANKNATRAAGFQRVCESTIEAMPILFVFQRENIPSFHMNNVVAPIDIAFIDENGRLESIHAMKPYSILQVKKPVYSSKKPVLYALEVHEGFFDKHNVSLNNQMTWSEANSDK